MPRKPRLEAEGLFYHIISRGIERREIFKGEGDCDDFLHRLGEALLDTKTELFAFCLMPNHFHLLLKSANTPVSTIMRRVLTGYAVNFNLRHKRIGHLFAGRYKAIICQEDPYFLELVRYIHLNPFRAKIVSDIKALERYPWSGHALIKNGKKKYAWYLPERVLSHFGDTKAKAKSAYSRFITDGIAEDKSIDFTGAGLKRSLAANAPGSSRAYQDFDDRILGDGDFVTSLISREDKKPVKNDQGQDLESLLEAVAKEFALNPKQIKGRSRAARLPEARAAVVYVASNYMGLTFAECARQLNIHKATAARLAVRGKDVVLGRNIEQWL